MGLGARGTAPQAARGPHSSATILVDPSPPCRASSSRDAQILPLFWVPPLPSTGTPGMAVGEPQAPSVPGLSTGPPPLGQGGDTQPPPSPAH